MTIGLQDGEAIYRGSFLVTKVQPGYSCRLSDPTKVFTWQTASINMSLHVRLVAALGRLYVLAVLLLQGVFSRTMVKATFNIHTTAEEVALSNYIARICITNYTAFQIWFKEQSSPTQDNGVLGKIGDMLLVGGNPRAINDVSGI